MGLEIVNRNVAGVAVGNESHYVAVSPGRDPQPHGEAHPKPSKPWRATTQSGRSWI